LPSRVGPVVLVADGSPDVRELTRLLLEVEGCFVIEARDGREAVETLLSKPDLILARYSDAADGWLSGRSRITTKRASAECTDSCRDSQ
jgi:CheY-like chemotaxis protein